MRAYLSILILVIFLISGCEATKTADSADKKVNEENSVIVDAKVLVEMPDNTTEDEVSDWVDLNPPKEVEQVEIPKEKTCEEWATLLVPNTVKLYEGQTQCERALIGFWKDGTPIKINNRKIEFANNKNTNLQMLLGSEEGEQIDRFYLKSYGGDILTFLYEKKINDNDGTIIGTNEFEIKVDSYEKLESSKIEDEALGCAYYEYRLGNYEFISCTKN